MEVKIIAYAPEYRDSIRVLNEVWLEKYFRIEKRDVLQLNDPEGEIIEKGGSIFYAQDVESGRIVGVVALMVAGSGVIELSKMAVDERFQGQGLGRLLASYALDQARNRGAKKVVLYTNTKLEAAIHLYQGFGFQEVQLEAGLYERANRKMELNFSNENDESSIS